MRALSKPVVLPAHRAGAPSAALIARQKQNNRLHPSQNPKGSPWAQQAGMPTWPQRFASTEPAGPPSIRQRNPMSRYRWTQIQLKA